MAFCPSCGTNLPAKARFCPSCGDALETYASNGESANGERVQERVGPPVGHATTGVAVTVKKQQSDDPLVRAFSKMGSATGRAASTPEGVRMFFAVVIIVLLVIGGLLAWHFTHQHRVCGYAGAGPGSYECHMVYG